MSTNRFQLIERILELSVADSWDEAKSEWEIDCIEQSEEPDTCLCGHFPINELCHLINSENGNSALVGNVCVNKFLEMESKKIFDCIGRIRQDIGKAPNPDLIDFVHRKDWVDDWQRGFLYSTFRKRKLTAEQLSIRKEINEVILLLVTRKRGTAKMSQEDGQS